MIFIISNNLTIFYLIGKILINLALNHSRFFMKTFLFHLWLKWNFQRMLLINSIYISTISLNFVEKVELDSCFSSFSYQSNSNVIHQWKHIICAKLRFKFFKRQKCLIFESIKREKFSFSRFLINFIFYFGFFYIFLASITLFKVKWSMNIQNLLNLNNAREKIVE